MKIDLDKYIGKKVKIKFFDNDIRIGTLGKGDKYIQPWIGKGYHLEEIGLGFKKSHVKKIEEVK